MGEAPKRIECRLITDADEIEAALASIADEPFMDAYHDLEFRRKHAEKLAKFAYVAAEYHDGQPIGIVAMYANDLESGVVYLTIGAVKASLGMERAQAALHMINKLWGLPAMRQMKRVRYAVDENNRYARMLYERAGGAYTGERDGNSLYMEIDLPSATRVLERLSRQSGNEG